MKTIIIILALLLILLFTYSNQDEIIGSIIKTEQKHLDRYNQIKRTTTDSLTKSYIDSIKNILRKDAKNTENLINENKNILNSLSNSDSLIKIYIDSLK